MKTAEFCCWKILILSMVNSENKRMCGTDFKLTVNLMDQRRLTRRCGYLMIAFLLTVLFR